MRYLNNSECIAIAGGQLPLADRLARDITVGGGAGSMMGVIVSNSAAGAARGGAVGAALGFAWGVGYAIGTSINDRFVEPWIMRQSS